MKMVNKYSNLQYSVVSAWQTPEEEMVAYRSFRPFFPLMAPQQPFPVQMWAAWAIHHVCSKNGELLLVLLFGLSRFEGLPYSQTEELN